MLTLGNCRKSTLLFSPKDPPLALAGMAKGVSSAATVSTMGQSADPSHANSLTFAINLDVVETTQESIAQKPPLTLSPQTCNDFSLQDVHVTPINVDRLEQELSDHPDYNFASTLCAQLRFGAHMGYKGPRVARFSRNRRQPLLIQ